MDGQGEAGLLCLVRGIGEVAYGGLLVRVAHRGGRDMIRCKTCRRKMREQDEAYGCHGCGKALCTKHAGMYHDPKIASTYVYACGVCARRLGLVRWG